MMRSPVDLDGDDEHGMWGSGEDDASGVPSQRRSRQSRLRHAQGGRHERNEEAEEEEAEAEQAPLAARLDEEEEVEAVSAPELMRDSLRSHQSTRASRGGYSVPVHVQQQRQPARSPMPDVGDVEWLGAGGPERMRSDSRAGPTNVRRAMEASRQRAMREGRGGSGGGSPSADPWARQQTLPPHYQHPFARSGYYEPWGAPYAPPSGGMASGGWPFGGGFW